MEGHKLAAISQSYACGNHNKKKKKNKGEAGVSKEEPVVPRPGRPSGITTHTPPLSSQAYGWVGSC